MSSHFDPGSALDAEMRRVAMPEIVKAIAELTSPQADRHKAVHRLRKQLKRMRALCALVRPVDDAFFKAENSRYRDIGRSLARPRTAAACVEAIDRFMQDYPKQCEGSNVDRLRRLMATRADGGDAMEGFDAAVNMAVASSEAGLAALGKFRADSDRDNDAEVLRLAIARNLKRVGRSLDAAKRDGRADDFHELRKAVKAHAVHVDLLAAVWPGRSADYAKSLDKLGQSLGDLHDITMVRSHLPQDPDAETQKAVNCLLKLMRRQEKRLQKRCVAKARGLLPSRPNKIAKAVAANWLQAAEARLAA